MNEQTTDKLELCTDQVDLQRVIQIDNTIFKYVNRSSVNVDKNAMELNGKKPNLISRKRYAKV